MTSAIDSVWRHSHAAARIILRCLAVVIFCMAGSMVFSSSAHGAEWNALGTGLNGSVNALVCDSVGNLYAGGYFTTAGGETVNYIAKWDGAEWSALGTGMDGPVFAIGVDSSDNLYAGGAYTTAGGVSANCIARWDGTGWNALGTGVNSLVRSLTCDSAGNLYAGGYFTTAGGKMVNYIAKWDGIDWYSLGAGIDFPVLAMACDSTDNLYAGGWFWSSGRIARWDGAGWITLGDDSQYLVNALEFDNTDNLYAGFDFWDAPEYINGVAEWNGAWDPVGISMTDDILALVCDSAGNLYAGGSFTTENGTLTTAGGEAANFVVKWDGAGWCALGSGLDYESYGNVTALTVDGAGNLYAGGEFTAANGVIVNNIAVWESGVDFQNETPAMDITTLIEVILGDESIAGNAKKSLVKKLENALKKREQGKEKAACNILNALINQIEALSGKKLTHEKATELIAAIQNIADGNGGVAKRIAVLDAPETFALSQNSPNPFNPSTTIQYTIPAEIDGNVTVKIYDLRGALVRTLVDRFSNPGMNSVVWDGTDEDANRVSSGVYIYQLKAGTYTTSKKMTLMR